ncbi:AAA family ATPase [Oribacterium sp. FC2011]|uniref:AAA family ATPase n=1 Tax=Oribacterium sp. FC2011 TaxID=1408311 RepID=UPI0004E20831|nr:AAA family ATPase [Oribacterium sp. FC2011]
MGIYLNPGNKRFDIALNSEIFVDKTEMLDYINTVVNTNQRYVCVSRPRRFGKTMAADMLCAYYDRTADSRLLFEKCKIHESTIFNHSEWDKYLGNFDVIRLVMTDFFKNGVSIDKALEKLQKLVVRELSKTYPQTDFFDTDDLIQSLQDVYVDNHTQFVIVIDEWDSIFREYKDDKDGPKKYLDFLRDLLKDKEYVALAYMTGILPIKKYGKHSALNMFDEYSMTQPSQLAPFMGFTSDEVKNECLERNLRYDSFKDWYDGYRLSNKVSKGMISESGSVDDDKHREYEIYSPYSVVKAILNKQFSNYWNQTETYEALRQYIDMNYDGLKEDIVVLMDFGRVKIDITGYQNDMTTFNSKDDILTMLIHLGYLSYDSESKEVFIPNKEVMDVFKSSTKSQDWTMTFRALQNSRSLLEATWNCDEEKVAELIEAAHNKAGNRTYNSEAGLSYAIQLAYYSAQDYYTIIPELDTGKGYADLVFIPKNLDKKAMLIELKYDENADSAIAQIHRQKYPERLEHYKGNLILVGINYDKEMKNDHPEFKHHSCKIERA